MKIHLNIALTVAIKQSPTNNKVLNLGLRMQINIVDNPKNWFYKDSLIKIKSS